MIEEIIDIDTGEGAMETFICRPDRGWQLQWILCQYSGP